MSDRKIFASNGTPEPLPFLGQGVDWEVYSRERPLRAIGFIGHEQVEQVSAKTRIALIVKMAVASLKWRHTPQISGGRDTQ